MMNEADLFRAKSEMLSTITLETRRLIKEGGSLEDLDEFLVVNQTTLLCGVKKRASPTKSAVRSVPFFGTVGGNDNPATPEE